MCHAAVIVNTAWTFQEISKNVILHKNFWIKLIEKRAWICCVNILSHYTGRTVMAGTNVKQVQSFSPKPTSYGLYISLHITWASVAVLFSLFVCVFLVKHTCTLVLQPKLHKPQEDLFTKWLESTKAVDICMQIQLMGSEHRPPMVCSLIFSLTEKPWIQKIRTGMHHSVTYVIITYCGH